MLHAGWGVGHEEVQEDQKIVFIGRPDSAIRIQYVYPTKA